MKAGRQRKILDIIKNEDIETQEDLARALKSVGCKVTQATISRDIKELGLIKVPRRNNVFCYAQPVGQPVPNGEECLKRVFRDSVVSLDFSENLIIIKTPPGGAQAVALAIDNMGWREIIGTVGGDDTIMVVVKPKEAVSDIIKKFSDLLSGK
ncbi:arginine repressor [Pelotomaculum propionicicum]|uniref:Arginine repressor n=1 Tax=Pelotomaculum propionicicum TaxID=258475 RepID=A0A4Y7RMS3_9FIRM|nr:arginine repressor [Pelotomaculum propionicicum]NLI12388.1 arginine repressor [Peptococcaceae bacterium]TEB10050.1 Arginine repressor [Pelotomaculum propionicicum]